MFDIIPCGSPDAAGPPVAGGRSEGGAFSDVSGAVLAHLLVPTLADLDAVPDGIAGDAMLVDLASDLARLEAWAVAQRARVLGTLVRRTEAELQRFGASVHSDGRGTAAAASHAFDDQRMAHRMVSTDLALATGTTTWVADRELDLAHGLAAHPRLATALANGRVDRRRTELVLAEVANLGEADRDRVIAKVVGDGTHAADDAGARDDLIRELRRPGTFLWQLPSAVLRRAVRRECAAIDADQAAKREALARINRHVTARSLPDAMAEFRVEAPAHAVSLMYANVDAAARAARARGDDRTLDQLRADISIGWLTEGALGTFVARPQQRPKPKPSKECTKTAQRAGHAFSVSASTHSASTDASAEDGRCRMVLPRPASVLTVIVMGARSALGESEDPATLFGPDGPVPIPAAVARQIAHDPTLSTWLGMFTDPRTGVAVDVSPHYRPPPRLRTFVRLRDGLRSRLPVSNASRIEIDHVDPYDHHRPAAGGQTTASGLVSVGAREHHLKTDGALAVAGDANGELVYTTHTGHAYVSWPEPWEERPRVVEMELPPRPRRDGPVHGDPPF